VQVCACINQTTNYVDHLKKRGAVLSEQTNSTTLRCLVGPLLPPHQRQKSFFKSHLPTGLASAKSRTIDFFVTFDPLGNATFSASAKRTRSILKMKDETGPIVRDPGLLTSGSFGFFGSLTVSFLGFLGVFIFCATLYTTSQPSAPRGQQQECP